MHPQVGASLLGMKTEGSLVVYRVESKQIVLIPRGQGLLEKESCRDANYIFLPRIGIRGKRHKVVAGNSPCILADYTSIIELHFWILFARATRFSSKDQRLN